jgi:hypothetical protein
MELTSPNGQARPSLLDAFTLSIVSVDHGKEWGKVFLVNNPGGMA